MNPNISALVASFLPDHVPARHPEFVEFAKAYFDFLEKSNMAAFYANSLPEQRSIYTQQDQFLQYIQRELGIFVPRVYAADPKVFYDKITELWRSKGSEEAIKTFFLLFLDDVVEVTYPWANVLIPSDGRWIKEDILRVTMRSGSASDLIGKQIKQVSSEAAAVVSKVESRTYSDGTIYDLTLVKGSIRREFDPQEDIVAPNVAGLRAEIYRSLNKFTIVNRGTGYKIGDRISVQGFDGFTFVAFVSAVSLTGEILDIQITNFGSGNTPIHVRLANIDQTNPAEYYLKDFILYQYLDDQRDGPQETWSDKLIAEATPTVLDITEAPGLGTRSTAFTQEYVEADDIFFADDYVGVSSTASASTPVQAFEQIRRVVLVINSENGIGAELLLNFGSITGYPGRYDGVNGQLDEAIVLQDSYYNQKYSYEVKTTYSTSEWINQLTRAVHPAGTKVFGNVAIFNKLDSRIKSGNIFIGESFSPSVNILEEVCVKERMLGFIQSYVESAGVYFAEDYVGTTVINELINQACENQTTDTSTGGSTNNFLQPLSDGNENVSTPYDTSVSGNLLNNASGGDGSYIIRSRYTVGDGVNAVTGIIGNFVVVPNVGTLTINVDGTYAFDPLPTFSGDMPPVYYTIDDQDFRTNDSTLTISVGAPPAAGTILSQGCIPNTFTYRVTRANGTGGSYNTDTLNSTQCGYVAPVTSPTIIGQEFGGGFYAGDYVLGGQTYHIILGPRSEAFRTGSASGAMFGVSNFQLYVNETDGLANTNWIAHPTLYQTQANTNSHYYKIRRKTINTYSDWYYPSKNELEVVLQGLHPGVTTNPLFQEGGSESLRSSPNSAATGYFTSSIRSIYNYPSGNSWYLWGADIGSAGSTTWLTYSPPIVSRFDEYLFHLRPIRRILKVT